MLGIDGVELRTPEACAWPDPSVTQWEGINYCGACVVSLTQVK